MWAQSSVVGCWQFSCLQACHLPLLETQALLDWRPEIPSFLLLTGRKTGIPNLWHWFTDTELLANLFIWGGVGFQNLKIWAQLLSAWVLFYLWFGPREPAASAQSICTYAANPTHCSLCMLCIAPLEKLRLPWVWGEEFSKAFIPNKFLLLRANIKVCLRHSSPPFLELSQQRYY